MKAITLTQPWASFVALGVKRFETRSWQTEYRGPIAIHAAKSTLDMPTEIGGWTATSVDDEWRMFPPSPNEETEHPLPLGMVVATARLVAVFQVLSQIGDWVWLPGFGTVPDSEIAFGDYTPGRYVWILHDVEPLAEPIPAKGRQGLWDWDEAEVSV